MGKSWAASWSLQPGQLGARTATRSEGRCRTRFHTYCWTPPTRGGKSLVTTRVLGTGTDSDHPSGPKPLQIVLADAHGPQHLGGMLTEARRRPKGARIESLDLRNGTRADRYLFDLGHHVPVPDLGIVQRLPEVVHRSHTHRPRPQRIKPLLSIARAEDLPQPVGHLPLAFGRSELIVHEVGNL